MNEARNTIVASMRSIERRFASMNLLFRQLGSVSLQVDERARANIAQISESLRLADQQLRPMWKWLEHRMARRRVCQHLLAMGWYLPEPASADAVCEIDALIADDHDHVDRYMSDLSRSSLASLAERVGAYWPERQPVVRDCVEAHGRCQYNLSIPVLLAQADGVLVEIVELEFFSASEKKRRDALAQLIDDVGQTSQHALYDSLHTLAGLSSVAESTRSPEWKQKAEADPSHASFNRHLILHGKDVEYGTEVNSLKAALILEYLVSFRDLLEEVADR
jgi:hypothetical protein